MAVLSAVAQPPPNACQVNVGKVASTSMLSSPEILFEREERALFFDGRECKYYERELSTAFTFISATKQLVANGPKKKDN